MAKKAKKATALKKGIVKEMPKQDGKTVLEDFKDDEKVKQLIREMRERRQKKIEETLEEKLTPEDWENFKEFKRLHELLFNKGRIEIKERGDNYDNAEFGVKVYGEEYWFKEKETENY